MISFGRRVVDAVLPVSAGSDDPRSAPSASDGGSSGPGMSVTPSDPAPFAYATKLAFAIVPIAVAGVILAVEGLEGLGPAPPELTPGEEALIRVADQIRFEGWIGLSHDLLAEFLTGYVYVLAFWTALVGDGAGMARLLSSVASLAAIGASYFLISLLFNRRVALFATLLMAVGIWPLTYARLALPVSLQLLVEVTALYLLFRAFRAMRDESARRTLLVVSGVLVGLSLYLDFAAIVFAAAAVCLWLRDYVSGAVTPRVLGGWFAAFAVPALLVSLPFWAVTATDPSVRDDVKALLITESPHYLESEGVMARLRTATGNVVNTGRALVWSTRADELGRGGVRIVDPLTGLLVFVGLLVCVRRWRDDSHGAILVLLLVVVILVGLTRQEGMVGRLAVAAPMAFTLAGIAVDRMLGLLKGRVPDAGVIVILAVLGAAIILFNLTTYYAHPLGEEPMFRIGTGIERSLPPQAAAWGGP